MVRSTSRHLCRHLDTLVTQGCCLHLAAQAYQACLECLECLECHLLGTPTLVVQEVCLWGRWVQAWGRGWALVCLLGGHRCLVSCCHSVLGIYVSEMIVGMHGCVAVCNVLSGGCQPHVMQRMAQQHLQSSLQYSAVACSTC